MTGRTRTRAWTWNRARTNAVVALLVLAYGAFQAAHLGGYTWDSDEGINAMKARLVLEGARLYTEVWADQPPGFTVAVAGAFAAFGQRMEVARAVALGHGMLALAASAALAAAAGGGAVAAVAAVAFLGLAPNAFWASRAAMIGLPALSLAMVGMAFVLAFERSRRRGLLVAAGLAFGLGLTEKLIGAYLALPVALVLLRVRRGDLAALGRDALALAAGAAAPLLAVAAAFDVPAMLSQTVGTVAAARGAYGAGEEAQDVAWRAEKLAFWLRYDHLFLVGPAAVGALRLLRARTTTAWALLAWLVAAVVALLVQTPLWPKHHVLVLLVVLAPLAALGVEAAVRAPRDWRAGRRTAAAIALAGAALGLAGVPGMLRANAARLTVLPFKESGTLPSTESWRHQHEAAALLRAATSPGDVVLTDHLVVALEADRSVPPALAVLSGKRLAVGGLDGAGIVAAAEAARPAAVLLWDGDRLSRFPEVVAWVEAGYAPAGELGGGLWRLWLRREAAP